MATLKTSTFPSAGGSIALRDRVGHDDLFQIRTSDLLVGRPRKHAMRKNGKDLVRTGLVQCLGNLADGTARVAHVVDDQAVLAADITDDVHHVGLVSPLATLVAKSQSRPKAFRVCACPLGSAGIGCDNYQVLDRVGLEILDHDRGGVKVVNRNVKKPLYLRRVQIDGQISAGHPPW